MPSNQYLIYYPNGIKRHVTRQELVSLDGLIQIAPREYSAASLQASIEQTNGPSYLAGLFTIEFNGKRSSERLETPKGMLNRLERMGFKPSEALS